MILAVWKLYYSLNNGGGGVMFLLTSAGPLGRMLFICVCNVIYKSVFYEILARKSQVVSLRVFSEEPIANRFKDNFESYTIEENLL